VKILKILFIMIACFFQVNVLSSYAEDNLKSHHDLKIRDAKLQYSLYLSKGFTARKYILGPNDVISISFLDMPNLNQENVRVQPDGKILLAPSGSIDVAGLTLDETKDMLSQNYKTFIKNPQISIKLVESRPFIVYVTGAVLNPGSYELNTATNTSLLSSMKPETYIERKAPILSNILVAAGGLSHDADLEHIVVTNKAENSQYEINLMNLLDKGDVDQDIYLMTGDNVYVPRLPTPLAVNEEKYKRFASATFSPHSIPVKVYGYVNNPGLIKLDSSQSLNLNSAITAAGGYLRESAYAPKKVFLSRADVSGKLVTKVVNPMSSDIAIMPNDIIYVPEKGRPLIGKAFDYMTRIILPASTFASAYNGWAEMFDPGRMWGR